MTLGHCWRCGAYSTLTSHFRQWLCEHCVSYDELPDRDAAGDRAGVEARPLPPTTRG